MKVQILLYSFLLLGTNAFSQQTTDNIRSIKSKCERRKNNISFEIPLFTSHFEGIAVSYSSLSYERILFNREKYFITGKINTEIVGTANSFSLNIGKKRDYLEIGVGQHIGWAIYWGGFIPSLGWSSYYGGFNNLYSVYPILGYRFQPLKHGFSFGIYTRPTRTTGDNAIGSPISGITHHYIKVIHSFIAFKVGYAF